MEVTNFWPPTADIYFEGQFLTTARLVGNVYAANYPSHMRSQLLELQKDNLLSREEASKRAERRTPDGQLVGIDISDVRFDLTIVPVGSLVH
jgi:hypothetical protein